MLANADTARVRRARRPPARTQEREAAMAATTTHHLPGPVQHEAVPDSPGERALQDALGTRDRAVRFPSGSGFRPPHVPACRHSSAAWRWSGSPPRMAPVAATAVSGPARPGFVRVLSGWALAYPDYRGNGVMASSGNMLENPHISMSFGDFDQELIGLHVNGRAAVLAEAWRGGFRQASLSRLLRMRDREPMSENLAKDVGVLAGKSGHNDIVDVSVVEGAVRRGDAVVTSNASHIRTIAEPPEPDSESNPFSLGDHRRPQPRPLPHRRRPPRVHRGQGGLRVRWSSG